MTTTEPDEFCGLRDNQTVYRDTLPSGAPLPGGRMAGTVKHRGHASDGRPVVVVEWDVLGFWSSSEAPADLVPEEQP